MRGKESQFEDLKAEDMRKIGEENTVSLREEPSQENHSRILSFIELELVRVLGVLGQGL